MLHGVKPEERRHNHATRQQQQPAALLKQLLSARFLQRYASSLQSHANETMIGAQQANMTIIIIDLLYVRAGDCGLCT